MAIDVKNEVRRLCFKGALLSALFLKRFNFFLEKRNRGFFFCGYALPALRVDRSVTGLTVYWTFL